MTAAADHGMSGEEVAGAARPAIAQLERLAAMPAIHAEAFDAIERYLSRPIMPETFEKLLDGPGVYFGVDCLTYLAFVSYDPSEFDEAMVGASQAAIALARRVVGLYGPDLSEAWMRWDFRQNHDWRSVTRTVVRGSDGEWTVSLLIAKKNGDKFTIAAQPDSVMRFATRVVRSLLEVDEASAFGADDCEELFNEVEELRSRVGAQARSEESAPAGE